MADPVRWDWLPGSVTETVLVIVQVNDAEPERRCRRSPSR